MEKNGQWSRIMAQKYPVPIAKHLMHVNNCQLLNYFVLSSFLFLLFYYCILIIIIMSFIYEGYIAFLCACVYMSLVPVKVGFKGFPEHLKRWRLVKIVLKTIPNYVLYFNKPLSPSSNFEGCFTVHHLWIICWSWIKSQRDMNSHFIATLTKWIHSTWGLKFKAFSLFSI